MTVNNLSRRNFVKSAAILSAGLVLPPVAIAENPPVFSGIPEFDRFTGGFTPGTVTILAGRPAAGKTALAIDIAVNAILTGHIPCLYFSIESTADKMAARFMAANGGISMPDKRFSHNLLHIDDQPSPSTTYIRDRCGQFVKRSGYGLVIIDYLQLMSEGCSTESNCAVISDLHDIANELGLPIILLSQVDRMAENRPNRRPLLADLRNITAETLSGKVGVVCLIYRDRVQWDKDTKHEPSCPPEDLAELHLIRPAGGDHKTIRLMFNNARGRFRV